MHDKHQFPEFDDSRTITYEQFRENMLRELASHSRRETSLRDEADPKRARERDEWFEFKRSMNTSAPPEKSRERDEWFEFKRSMNTLVPR
jgi:hypothetical protein